MAKSSKTDAPVKKGQLLAGYDTVLKDVAELLESARRASVRATNAVMTATYWEIGRRIVEFEQSGAKRAEYGEAILRRLSNDLILRFGKGFGLPNLKQFRKFYLTYENIGKGQTLSDLSKNESELRKSQTVSGKSEIVHKEQPVTVTLSDISKCFPLPWSHYVRLISLKNPEARSFYEKEALRGGWTVRQMGRQIGTQFYERTMMSKNKAAMLKKGAEQLPGDAVTPEEEIKDSFVLEFLGLKDEYSGRLGQVLKNQFPLSTHSNRPSANPLLL